jgi:hypothetical protein
MMHRKLNPFFAVLLVTAVGAAASLFILKTASNVQASSASYYTQLDQQGK